MEKSYCHYLSLLIIGAACSQPLLAEEELDLFALDIAELAKIKISSAAKTSDTIADAPASITVISKEQIQRSGKRRWFEILEQVAGWTGLNGIHSSRSFVVRGVYTENGVLVLIDGTPVNDPFSGRFDLFDLPLSLVERIEVVRGPGSAMFGGNALIAVINVITQTGKTDRPVRAAMALGSEHYRAVDAKVQFNEDDWQLRWSAGISVSAEDGGEREIKQDRLFSATPGRYLPPLANPTLTPTSRRENLHTLSAFSHLNWQHWEANYFYGRSETTPLLSSRGVVVEQDESLRVDALNLLTLRDLQWQHENWSITPKLYYRLDQNKSLGDSEPPQILGDDNQDGLNETFPSGIIESMEHDTRQYGADLQWTFALSDEQKMNIGLSRDIAKLSHAKKFSNASFNSRAAIAVFPVADLSSEFIVEDIERRSNALALEHRWSFDADWALTSSIRYNAFSDFGDASSPRIGLNYTPGDAWYHKWLYATAFLPPAFNQLFDRTPTLTQFRRRGNSALKASEISSYEWIVGRELRNAWRSEFSLSYNETENEIFFNRQAGIERWQNGASRKTTAAEATLLIPLSKTMQLDLQYAYQNSTGIDNGIAADIHPHHRAGLKALWRSRHWQANLALQYYSRAIREPNDQRDDLAAKVYVDFTGSRHDWLGLVNVHFSINNLFDERGNDEINAAEGLRDDVPRAGRSLWLKLEKAWR